MIDAEVVIDQEQAQPQVESKKPKKSHSGTATKYELVVALVREYRLSVEDIRKMNIIELSRLVNAGNKDLMAAYLNKHGKRMKEYDLAFPGYGAMHNATSLTLAVEGWLEKRGMTLTDIGWWKVTDPHEFVDSGATVDEVKKAIEMLNGQTTPMTGKPEEVVVEEREEIAA